MLVCLAPATSRIILYGGVKMFFIGIIAAFFIIIGIVYPLCAAIIYPIYRALCGKQSFFDYMKDV